MGVTMKNQQYMLHLFDLSGKKAVVTGGSQGIGRAVAVSLAAFGAEVTVLGLNQHLLDETVKIIADMNGICHAENINVTDWERVDAFFTGYVRKNGRLDIFVNNAGYTVHAELADTTREEIDGLLETNVKAGIHCMQLAANIMKPQGCGNIVVITSVNALNSHPGQGMYSVTKFALEGAMKALASTLAEYGIRVNSCAPGVIDTAINAKALSDPATVKVINSKIAMHKVGMPEDVGDVVACMVSDACRYMTGATVVVDGGMMLKQK